MDSIGPVKQPRPRAARDADPVDFADGPTLLPAPCPPARDPDFLTGTMLQLERADLAAGRDPAVEPSDSEQATVRFSREEVQAIIAVRLQTARPAAPATQALPPRPRPLPRAAGTSPPLAGRLWPFVLAYHRPALHLALAFALGVLTAVLAMR